MRILVALGGNAIKRPADRGTVEEMILNLQTTCAQLVKLIKNKHQLCLTHGNGPQVGQIYLRNQLCANKIPAWPLNVCVAESEGLLGYLFQREFHNALQANGRENHTVATLVTQTEVLSNDAAFARPNKPIGSFYSEAEARNKMAQDPALVLREDSGRGWRQVVASPKPVRIIEAKCLRALCALDNTTVIACGGGGIPVIVHPETNTISGCEAVVDKDFAAVLLALEAESDLLLLVTDVEHAYTDFSSKQPRKLTRVTVAEAKVLVEQGHFGEGSMRPKVEACIEFVQQTNKAAVITSLDRVEEAVMNGGGTWFVPE